MYDRAFHFALILSTSFLSLTVACDATSEDPISETAHPVLYSYTGVDSVVDEEATSIITNSVGATRRTYQGTNRQCGVTFISPHYAVTATHCAPREAIPFGHLGSINVEQITASGVSPSALLAHAVVDSTWPTFMQVPLTANAGYTKTTLACQVRVRCGGADPVVLGHEKCTPTVSFELGRILDVAILYCPSRGQTEDYVYQPTTSASPAIGTPSETWWFHEIVDAPNTSPGGNAGTATSLFDHYTSYLEGDDSNNYHYSALQQLLPLVTRKNSAGTAYAYTGFVPNILVDPNPNDDIEVKPQPGYARTSVPPCHGTSGSGVFAQGSTYVTGVTHSGTTLATNGSGDRLCADPANASNFSITTLPANLVAITSDPRITLDRNGTQTGEE